MSQGRQHTSGADDALSRTRIETDAPTQSEHQSEERETVTKPPVKKSIFARVPRLPLAFLGIALYRAWIELAFVGSYLGTSLQAETSRNLFDGTMVVVFLLGAIFQSIFAPHSETYCTLDGAFFFSSRVYHMRRHRSNTPRYGECPHVACRYLRRNRCGSNRHSLVRALRLPRPGTRRAVLLSASIVASSTHRLHHEGLSLPRGLLPSCSCRP